MFGVGAISFGRLGGVGGGSSAHRVVFSGSATIPEDTATSSSLGTFSVTLGSGTYVYAITAGNGAGKFSISTATLVLAGALDYETTPSYSLTITANNSVDPILTLNLTINVGDVLDTAAVLTSPTGAQTGATTATGTVSTNQASGTFYWVVTASATPPSAAQVKAGQNNGGTAAAALGSAAAVSGTNTFNATGLTAATTYYFYFMQENAVPLQSTVSASASFVTLTVPAVSSVALSSSAGADNTYAAGDVVQATVTFNVAVSVTGTPQLTLNVGGVSKTANYASGSTSTALVFSYTVQAGDTDTNGISIGANALALNSGTIKDTATGTVTATITHSSVADNASHKVDTTAPTISVLTPLDNATGTSLTNNLTVQFSESVAFNSTVVIGLYKGSDDSHVQDFTAADIAGAISITTDTLTINPTSDLATTTDYYVLIGATSIKDLAGNFFAGISSKTTWNFTSGAGTSAEALQFFSRITDPGATRKGQYATLIDGLVTDGIWAKLDALWILAADIAGNAIVNLKSSSFTLTNHGATFTTDRGYTGDGAAAYLDTGYDPRSAGGQWAQSSAHMGSWARTNSGGSECELGDTDNFMNLATSGGGFQASINSTSGLGGTQADTQKHTVVTIRSAGDAELYHKASSVVTSASGTRYLDFGNFYLLSRQGVGQFATNQIAAAHVGGGLTATNVTNFGSRLQTYMTAVGA